MRRFAGRSRCFGVPLCAALALTMLPAAPNAQTVTTLLRSGPNGSKKNIVVIGDGFTSADQSAYNAFVNNMVVAGVFDEGRNSVYRETMNAFNIFRINANSAQSGITLVDSTGAVTTAVNTFLGYQFSGIWGRCWMEPGPTSNATLQTTLDNLVPGWTYAFIVLNTPSWGGVRTGQPGGGDPSGVVDD